MSSYINMKVVFAGAVNFWDSYDPIASLIEGATKKVGISSSVWAGSQREGLPFEIKIEIPASWYSTVRDQNKSPEDALKAIMNARLVKKPRFPLVNSVVLDPQYTV